MLLSNFRARRSLDSMQPSCPSHASPSHDAAISIRLYLQTSPGSVIGPARHATVDDLPEASLKPCQDQAMLSDLDMRDFLPAVTRQHYALSGPFYEPGHSITCKACRCGYRVRSDVRPMSSACNAGNTPVPSLIPDPSHYLENPLNSTRPSWRDLRCCSIHSSNTTGSRSARLLFLHPRRCPLMQTTYDRRTRQ